MMKEYFINIYKLSPISKEVSICTSVHCGYSPSYMTTARNALQNRAEIPTEMFIVDYLAYNQTFPFKKIRRSWVKMCGIFFASLVFYWLNEYLGVQGRAKFLKYTGNSKLFCEGCQLLLDLRAIEYSSLWLSEMSAVSMIRTTIDIHVSLGERESKHKCMYKFCPQKDHYVSVK